MARSTNTFFTMLAAFWLHATPDHATPDDLSRVCFEDTFGEESAASPVTGFTAYGGTWETRGHVLYAGPGAGPKLIADVPALAEGSIGVDILFPDRDGGNAGLIVKVSDAGIGADAFNGYEISLDIRDQCLRLGRHRQNFELIRDTPCEVPVNTWVSLVVRMEKTALEVRVNGDTIIEYDDRQSPLAAGTFGIRPWQRTAYFRQLRVRRNGVERLIPFEATGTDGQPHTFRGWRAVSRGSARTMFNVEYRRNRGERGVQTMTFLDGDGEAGIQYSGRDGSGIPFVGGSRYHGYVTVRSAEPADVCAAVETAGSEILDETSVHVTPGAWQNLHFALSPSRSEHAGRLTIKLKEPGSISIGGVRFEPADWAWPQTLRTAGLPRIALISRHPLSHPNTISCDIWQAQPSGPGCSIRIIDPAHPERPAETVFLDPDGCIYDVNISHDARTLFFSYRPKNDRYWHIWRIGTDGTGLRQLTDGKCYDISPCPLPNGNIVFVSTRRFGYTVCQPGPASNLHAMAPDGSDIRCISMNTLSDFSPNMLPDGRILFTRWEYIDRDLTYRQSLWTQNPDGTAYQLFFGNTIRDVGTFWQARPLPGCTDRVVATFAPHHHWPHGAIGLIDRTCGVEGAKGKGYVYVTREFPSIMDQGNEWSYRDPFPLSDRVFLCSYGGGGVYRFRTHLLDVDDNKRLLYEDPEMGCYFPIPLRPLPIPRDVPSQLPVSSWSAPTSTVDNATGTLLLADVYRGMEPTIARGRAKVLRVMEQIRKTEDLHARAYDQSPVMSYGTYYAKRCWGTVPIMEDGSAHFEAPALREIYFQVLDAEGRELQRMTSAVQLMPGERASCVGCHESRDSSPPAGSTIPMAARRPAMKLQTPDWGNDGIVTFTTLVQPVLDRYCVECHSGTDPKGGYDFSGGTTRYFNMAYDNLLGRSRSYRQHDMQTGEMLTTEKDRGKPLVHFFWLLRTPSGVNQPLWTGSHASRLTEIIESDHCKQTIPLEDRQRVYMWIDANVPYYGTYAHSRPRSSGKRDLFTDVATGRYSQWFTRDFLDVYNRRCISCHGTFDGTINWEGRYAWINLANPELSPALTAHLPKTAGGRGLERAEDGKPIPMFSGRDDPDYLAMRNAISVGRALAIEQPRADMPGFRGRRTEP